MVKRKLTKEDREAIKRLEIKEKRNPFITYGKNGRVFRHRTLLQANISARKQSLLGQKRVFIDKDMGKFIKSIKIIEKRPKIIRKR